VVIGALRPDGRLDLDTIARIADAARSVRPDVPITVHRAVDSSSDPVVAVNDLVGAELGVIRILTSGGATAVGDGLSTIADMVVAADGRIQIMSGGGVTPATIPALIRVGVDAVHMSAKRNRRDHFTIDPELVSAARALISTVD
jgi:copper homeostasis protein